MAGILNVTFSAGAQGVWQVQRIVPGIGDSLPSAPRLSMIEGAVSDHGHAWQLRGVVSNPRYSTASELKQLTTVSPPLGRPGATAAALIPIRKSETWWRMGQDERREIF